MLQKVLELLLPAPTYMMPSPSRLLASTEVLADDNDGLDFGPLKIGARTLCCCQVWALPAEQIEPVCQLAALVIVGGAQGAEAGRWLYTHGQKIRGVSKEWVT